MASIKGVEKGKPSQDFKYVNDKMCIVFKFKGVRFIFHCILVVVMG